MAIQSFRDLDVWKVSMDLTISLYEIVRRLPPEERFELASQMRRAAVSVPSNVAEGHATDLRRRYRNHVRIALGSVGDLSTCIEICRRLHYIDQSTADRLQKDLARTRQLLHGVLRDLARQLAKKATTTLIVLASLLWWTS